MNILLSICIPTYNQVGELRETLKSLVPQLKEEVEVVIGDDSDNLDSSEMIKREFSSYPIRHFKNEKRLGFDKNLLFVTGQARGRYIWWFGDDVFEPDALSYILPVLKRDPEISFLWVNSINSSSSGHRFPSLPYTKDKIWPDGNEVLKDASNLLAFVSAIVFRKEDIADLNVEKMEKIVDLGFINLHIVLHLLSKKNKFYCVSKPLFEVKPTAPGMHNYNRFQVLGINYCKVASAFRGKFARKSMRVLLANNFGHVWRGVLVGWLRGYDTPRGKTGAVLRYYWSFPEAWAAMLLFLMPKFVTRFSYFFYKRILRRTYSTA